MGQAKPVEIGDGQYPFDIAIAVSATNNAHFVLHAELAVRLR